MSLDDQLRAALVAGRPDRWFGDDLNALDFDLAAEGVGLGVYDAIARFHALASVAA
jgi:hypothetical protein